MILLDSVFLCWITLKDMADGVLSFCFVVYREIIITVYLRRVNIVHCSHSMLVWMKQQEL